MTMSGVAQHLLLISLGIVTCHGIFYSRLLDQRREGLVELVDQFITLPKEQFYEQVLRLSPNSSRVDSALCEQVRKEVMRLALLLYGTEGMITVFLFADHFNKPIPDVKEELNFEPEVNFVCMEKAYRSDVDDIIVVIGVSRDVFDPKLTLTYQLEQLSLRPGGRKSKILAKLHKLNEKAKQNSGMSELGARQNNGSLVLGPVIQL